jgi:hypothetical protein
VKIAKMKHQEILLATIRTLIPKSISLNDEIAKILDISYDAAHRRISLKSKFSIEETIQLCKHYKISMDSLFCDKNHLIMEKTKKIETLYDFKNYFETTNAIVSTINPNETTIFYAAKDIPMNYAVSGTLFSKFKFFIWYNLLNKEETSSFEQFAFEETVVNENNYLKNFFEKAKRIEIWNDTTINSSLQQVTYFFEAGLLNYQNALHIIKDINEIINEIERKCESNADNFQLYFNELLILNNTALFSSKNKSAFFLPYNALGYFVTSDKKTCKEQQDYISNQLTNSKSMNQSGKKDRKIFFNRMYQKIEFHIHKIENSIL